MTPHARPRKAAKGSKLRKRHSRARTPRVVVIDLNDPKWADLREQLEDDTPVSAEEEAAHMRWLRTGLR